MLFAKRLHFSLLSTYGRVILPGFSHAVVGDVTNC